MERGKFGNGVKRRLGLLTAMLLGLLTFGSLTAMAADYNIDQVSAVLPNVIVYYTMPDGGQDQLTGATLGADALEILSDQSFAETGEKVQYYALLDTSKSVRESDFYEALSELTKFHDSLREGDELILSTFGDSVNAPVLTGGESNEEAAALISGIQRESMNTYLIKSILQAVTDIQVQNASEAIAIASDPSLTPTKRVLIVISDGFDDADSTVGSYSAVSALSAAGVPVYTLGLNASLDRSEEEKKSKRADLNDIANSTSGTPWSVDEGTPMESAFAAITQAALNDHKATMKAPNNQTGDESKTLELQFASGRSVKRSVTAAGSIPDTTAPEVTVADSGTGIIRVAYSEMVTGAADRNHYLVRHDGKNLSIVRISEVESNPTVVELNFEEETLENGDYEVTITGITDASKEANALVTDGQSASVTISSGREPETTDEIAPQVTASSIYNENEGFQISYSEEVTGSTSNGSYRVTLDGKTVAVTQAAMLEGEENTVLVLTAEPLSAGTYTIRISNVKDLAGNALEGGELTLTVDDTTAPEITAITQDGETGFAVSFSEPVVGADAAGAYVVTRDGESVDIETVTASESQENTYLVTVAGGLSDAEYAIDVVGVTDAAGNMLQTEAARTLKANIADTTAPQVAGDPEVNEGQDGFVITFSEPVQGAAINGNYKVTSEERTIPVQQAIYTDSTKSVNLILAERLKNTDYEIEISNVTDAAGNRLDGGSLKVTVADVEEETEPKEDNEQSVLDLILKWWPIVLTALVAILAIIFAIVLKKRPKNPPETVVVERTIGPDGEVILEGQGKVDPGLHIGIEEPTQPQQMITLWLSNGRDEPKCIQQNINGSLIVGRSSKECDIYCDDARMSKQHFMLSVEGDGLYVTDLNSTNGTSVNGVVLSGQRRLMPRDEIMAGNIRFRVEW